MNSCSEAPFLPQDNPEKYRGPLSRKRGHDSYAAYDRAREQRYTAPLRPSEMPYEKKTTMFPKCCKSPISRVPKRSESMYTKIHNGPHTPKRSGTCVRAPCVSEDRSEQSPFPVPGDEASVRIFPRGPTERSYTVCRRFPPMRRLKNLDGSARFLYGGARSIPNVCSQTVGFHLCGQNSAHAPPRRPFH